jgi:glycosyltransferase involved in cell wall biosynthesis
MPVNDTTPANGTRKLISIVTPCFNEEGNVRLLYEMVKTVFQKLGRYDYEHIFIDNASTDGTVPVLKELAQADRNVKIIVNARNFGHIRSPYHALLQAGGDAVIAMAADLQDPPALIVDFLHKWEEGYKVVLGVKTKAEESFLMHALRSAYYKLAAKLSDVELMQHVTGFGLYDRRVIEILRQIDDPYPYIRGLIADIGFASCKVPYAKPRRKRGLTKNNFYTLYDLAMLGITNHSKVPLRVATMAGFLMSAVSLLTGIGYLVAKLVFWDWFTVGVAPILISLFFFSSVQLFFLGMLGEYIGAIHRHVQKRPVVIESERVNFDPAPAAVTPHGGEAVAARPRPPRADARASIALN